MSVSAQFKDKKAQIFLELIEKRSQEIGESSRDVGKVFGPTIFQDVDSHFEKQMGPSGPWKPWSKPYERLMASKGKGGNRKLQDTGRLRQAFTPAKFKKVRDGLIWFNPAKTRGGFPYAAHHDETARKTRPFMWISKKTLGKLATITLDRINRRGAARSF